MTTLQPYWDMEFEPKLNSPEMKEIQWGKLKKKIEYLYNNTSFWKERMDKAGTKPGDIKTWDDFHKGIPVFKKEDYRDYEEKCNGDSDVILKGLMGEDVKKMICLAATSGTTGVPTPYPMTAEDFRVWSECIKRCLWRCGIFPGDKVLHGMGLSMFIGGVPTLMGVADYGACTIPVGAEAGTEQILKYARQFKPDAIFCTPSLAEYLIQKSIDVTGEGVDVLGIKALLCGGEAGAGIPEVREKIEKAFKAKLFDFGGGGCSCDYPEYQGMHYLLDDLHLFELVHPDTHEHVPMEDGALGMIAFTQLDGLILLGGLRQSSNDIFEVFTSPCPCGKTGFRYKIIGRVDDMIKVKGVMIYPAAVEGVINGFVPRVTGAFRIVLDERPPRVVPPLKIKIEYGEGVHEEQLETLAAELEEAMHRQIKIRPKIIWVSPNSLERFLKKKKYFEKTYEK